jgi:hypothetical protein
MTDPRPDDRHGRLHCTASGRPVNPGIEFARVFRRPGPALRVHTR